MVLVIMSTQGRIEGCLKKVCEHGPLVTDIDEGEVTCGSCGVVLHEKTVSRDFQKFILNEDFMSKTSFGPKLKLSFNDMGLSTVINSRDIDSAGKKLSVNIRNDFYRLRKWDRNSKTKSKKLTEPFTVLDALRTKLNLPEIVVENSAYLYRKAVARNMIRGRSKIVFISASVYVACRITNTPRTLTDIAKAANLHKKEIQKSYRKLVKEFNLNVGSFGPINFISRLASAAQVEEKTRLDAIKFLNIIQKMEIVTGRNPIGIASAALYLSCICNNEKISQGKIAEAAGTTSVTVRNGYKCLENHWKNIMGRQN